MQRHVTRIALVLLSLGGLIACDKATSPTAASATPTSTTYLSVVMPATLVLRPGDTSQLRPVATLFNGSFQTISGAGTWTSSAASVATVNESGVVRGVGAGTADITVTLDGLTAKATVTVSPSAATATTLWGVVAATGGESGTVTLSLAASPFVSGTLFLARAGTALIGRVDTPTNIVNIAGGGYTLLGVLKGSVLTGAFTDPNGATGGFAAIDATHIAVTPYCGTYESTGLTILGNTDAGAVSLAVAQDGTVSGASVPTDGSTAPVTFVGRRTGDAIALATSLGGVLSGTVRGDSASGTFRTAAGSTATLTATPGACH